MSATKFSECKSCGAERSELRRRVLANSSVQIVYQCLTCGRSACNPLPKSSVVNPDHLPSWDESLQDRYNAEYQQRRFADKAEEKQQWLKLHNAYLQSSQWKQKRSLVMARANGLCEGCRVQPATQVHHLTYLHWKNEFLWELAAICDECHERVHESK